LLDVYCGELVPPAADCPRDRPVVAKATISRELTFAEQAERFRPHRTVFVLRHPAQTYVSLMRKECSGMGRDPDHKRGRLERDFAQRDQFDAVVHYEDVVLRPEIALGELRRVDPSMTVGAFALERRARDVIAATRAVEPFGEQFGKVWDKGNVDARAID